MYHDITEDVKAYEALRENSEARLDWTDFRSRRIPNWLTVPGFVFGLASNTFFCGWEGLRISLPGALVGLGLLLPLVLLRSLGAGDWKLAAEFGAFTGPGLLINLLFLSAFWAAMMAIVLIIYKGRVRETLSNISHILVSVLRFQLPGHRVSLDNPESLKVPYGVALALSVFFVRRGTDQHGLLIGTLAGMLLIGLIEFLNALTSMIYGRDVLSDRFTRNRCPQQ